MKFSDLLFKIQALTGYFHVLQIFSMQIIYGKSTRKTKKYQAKQGSFSVLQ
jgi:hypothetical protein